MLPPPPPLKETLTGLYFSASFELLTSDTNKDNEILVMLCAWFAFLQGTVNALWQLHNHTKANMRDENDTYKEEGICNEGKINEVRKLKHSNYRCTNMHRKGKYQKLKKTMTKRTSK